MAGAKKREENFKRFPKNCIIRDVPLYAYFVRGTIQEYGKRQGPLLDVIKQGDSLGFMSSSDGMVFFDRSHSDLPRVYYRPKKNTIGGKLL